jgi:hypothetical protein
MSKAYTAKRKEIAAGMDLGANLEKARAARTGKTQGKTPVKAQAKLKGKPESKPESKPQGRPRKK